MSWNGSNQEIAGRIDNVNCDHQQSCKIQARRKILVGCITIAIISIATWCALNHLTIERSAETEQEILHGQVIEESHSIVYVEKNQCSATEDEELPSNEYEKRFHGEKITSIMTNATGYVVVNAIQPNGRPIRHIVQPPTTFEIPTDELIMVALTTPEEHELPPLPKLGGSRADVEFLKSLNIEIKDLPGDSERTRILKQIVRDARAEIKERIDAGEHFADILSDYRKLRNENTKIRNGAVSTLQSLVNSGDTEAAEHYRNVVNTEFSKIGITPLEMPETTNEHINRIFKKGK